MCMTQVNFCVSQRVLLFYGGAVFGRFCRSKGGGVRKSYVSFVCVLLQYLGFPET